ncbi:MAG: four helix bundle protein [Aggregatilineales bacterium]
MKVPVVLKVWEKSHHLTLAVYKQTKLFPSDERFGLISQMRRAASSIPANIAEGCGKNTEADLARYIQIGMGSASELEYHLMLAYDLEYLVSADYQTLNGQVVEVKRMLSSFIKRLRQ